MWKVFKTVRMTILIISPPLHCRTKKLEFIVATVVTTVVFVRIQKHNNPTGSLLKHNDTHHKLPTLKTLLLPATFGTRSHSQDMQKIRQQWYLQPSAVIVCI